MRTLEPLESRTLLCFSAPITSGGAGSSLAVGDFNNDAKADVAVFVGSKVSVRLSNGDGTFRQSSTLSGVTGNPITIFTPSDQNGDGKMDLSALGFRATKNTGNTAG